MNLRNVTRKEFVAALTDLKEDSFAKTFIRKADMQKLWQHCIGAWEDEALQAAIITTISKSSPKIANLQLLHTFAAHRRKGIARALCDFSLFASIELGAEYYRVSAEPGAVEFYKSIGMCMLGKQKSGTSLSMFKINGREFKKGIYNPNDPVIYAAVHKQGKGGCVTTY